MRPGILALTSTSFASTVPISFRSPDVRAVTRYQINEPTVSSPKIRNTRLRAFILTPKLESVSVHFRHGRIRKHTCGKFGPMLAVGEHGLPHELDNHAP